MIGGEAAEPLLALARALVDALLAVLAVLALLVWIKASSALRERWRRRRRRHFAPGIDALLVGERDAALARLRPLWPGDRAVLESALLNAFGSLTGPLRAEMTRAAETLGLVERRRRQLSRRARHRRAAAMEALGRLGSRSAVPDLLAAFRREPLSLKAVAARALGRLRDPEALPVLLDELAALPPGAARPVVHAVEAFGETAVPTLLERLVRPDGPRAACADLLGRIRPLSAVAPLAETLATANDPDLRRACAEALGRIGHPDAVEPLRAALRAPFRELRASAAWALGRCADPSAAPDLEPLLDDPHLWTALRAAEALARLGAPGREALERARGRPDERVRRLAGEMLALA